MVGLSYEDCKVATLKMLLWIIPSILETRGVFKSLFKKSTVEIKAKWETVGLKSAITKTTKNSVRGWSPGRINDPEDRKEETTWPNRQRENCLVLRKWNRDLSGGNRRLHMCCLGAGKERRKRKGLRMNLRNECWKLNFATEINKHIHDTKQAAGGALQRNKTHHDLLLKLKDNLTMLK